MSKEQFLADIVVHINAWGQQRYEAGRQDIQDLLDVEREHVSQCVRNLETMRTRAEAAEAALAEIAKYFGEMAQLIEAAQAELPAFKAAALVSRPAVDLEQLLGAVARGWCHPGCTDIEMDTNLATAIAEEVQALLSGKVEAPTKTIVNTAVRVCPERDIECGRNPSSWCATCPNRPTADAVMPATPRRIVEKHCFVQCSPERCDCKNGNPVEWEMQQGIFKQQPVPPTASADGLPPLPLGSLVGTGISGVVYSESQLLDYARQARADALEEAGRMFEKMIKDQLSEAAMLAVIRALNKKG